MGPCLISRHRYTRPSGDLVALRAGQEYNNCVQFFFSPCCCRTALRPVFNASVVSTTERSGSNMWMTSHNAVYSMKFRTANKKQCTSHSVPFGYYYFCDSLSSPEFFYDWASASKNQIKWWCPLFCGQILFRGAQHITYHSCVPFLSRGRLLLIYFGRCYLLL